MMLQFYGELWFNRCMEELETGAKHTLHFVCTSPQSDCPDTVHENAKRAEKVQRLLGHPNCRLTSILFSVMSESVSYENELGPIGALLNHCKEPGSQVKEIAVEWQTTNRWVALPDEVACRDGMYTQLIEALTAENNTVESLELSDPPYPIVEYDRCNFVTRLLAKTLLMPHCKLRRLRLKRLKLLRTDLFSRILRHPRCTLRELYLEDVDGDARHFGILLEGNAPLSRLERLHVNCKRVHGNEAGRSYASLNDAIVSGCSSLIQADGNNLEELELLLNCGPGCTMTAAIPAALKSPNCRLRILRLRLFDMENPTLLHGIVEALETDSSSLMHELDYFDNSNHHQAELSRLSAVIKTGRSRLRSFTMNKQTFNYEDNQGVLDVLDALTTPGNTLADLSLLTTADDAFGIQLCRSLMSSTCRLRSLTLHVQSGTLQSLSTYPQIIRAVRVSNLQSFVLRPFTVFSNEFKQGWFVIVVAMVSARLIPRLGRQSWIRILPVETFIPKIAETLQWNLSALSDPTLEPYENSECAIN